jgi:hypothetical protein
VLYQQIRDNRKTRDGRKRNTEACADAPPQTQGACAQSGIDTYLPVNTVVGSSVWYSGTYHETEMQPPFIPRWELSVSNKPECHFDIICDDGRGIGRLGRHRRGACRRCGRGLLSRAAYTLSRSAHGTSSPDRGHLEAHLFSLNPRVIAERVTIGNPPWMPAGVEGRHPQKVSTSQRRLIVLIGVIFVRTTPHRHLTLLDSLLASFAPTMPLVHR